MAKPGGAPLSAAARASFPNRVGRAAAPAPTGAPGHSARNETFRCARRSIQGGDGNFPLSALYGSNGVYSETSRHFYAAASEPYLSLPTAESHGCRYVSYEDEQSLIAKGAYSVANGYGGTIIWTINQGYVSSIPSRTF